MEIIKVRSKMEEKDLKNYLLFDQYFGKPYYIRLRVILSLVIGAAVGYFSQEHLTSFLLITGICLVVLLLFPKWRIGFKAPQIYRRNRSGAFHQSQDFAFGETRFGFKAENEDDYDWTPYSSLNRIIETKTLLILEYARTQRAIVVKNAIEAEDMEKIRGFIREAIGDKFAAIDRW